MAMNEKKNFFIPTCNILGVNIAAINMKWIVSFLNKNLKKLSGEYICISNVHTTVMSYEDEKYCEIQNNAILALPDGGPLSTLGRKRGHSDMERVTGPGLMKEIFDISEEEGYSHYFYGSTDKTLNKLKKKLYYEYPNLKIVGLYSPPFKSLTQLEDELIIKEINEKKPDFIWVGLGAPKQENWMANHRGKLKGLMVGVGAGFDYFSGSIKRAPLWMQKSNLEWFYRLVQEPRRLFSRYAQTNTKFLWLIMRGR